MILARTLSGTSSGSKSSLTLIWIAFWLFSGELLVLLKYNFPWLIMVFGVKSWSRDAAVL